MLIMNKHLEHDANKFKVQSPYGPFIYEIDSMIFVSAFQLSNSEYSVILWF